MCVEGGHVQVPVERLEETSRSPRVTGSCELRMWVLGTEPSPSPL